MNPNQVALEQEAKMGNNPEQNPMWSTPKPDLSQAQIKERAFDLYRLYQISQVRESAQPQFDGMGYMRYNETNEMADISYLAPKKNKGDSRITTGTTHEKDSSIVGFYLTLNFEGTVKIFHQDQEINDLGIAITKLERKSREQEDFDAKRPDFYRNYTVQGTSFATEEYCEHWVPDKQIIGPVDPTSLDTVKWKDNGYVKVKNGCEINLTDGKKVFLEDIRQRDIQKQPGVYTVEYVPREILLGIWGKTSQWKYVPYFVTPTAQALGTLTQGSIYSDWIYGEIDFNKCEVIKVYRPFEGRYQVYINGIAMLPPGFPLKAVSPSGLIPIAKGDGDIMNLYAYSKSEPAKMKIDQAVFDEILQNMIIKFRQSAFVPRVNNSDKIISPEMFLGGKVISNIDPTQIQPLIENPGITQFDFSFYELFKNQLDSKSVSALFEGNPNPNVGSVPLQQYLDQQKRQLLKIGGKLDGLIQWHKQMLKLRVYNLLAHGYEQDASGNYKSITMHDKMRNGSKGLNIMKFAHPLNKKSADVFNEEHQYKKKHGQPADITYLDPVLMKSIIEDPSYYMCFEIVPVDKNNDALAQITFVNMIMTAAQLFGMDSLQVAGLKKQYAALMGKSFDDLFLSPEQQQLNQMQAQMNSPQNPGAKPGQPGPGQPGFVPPQSNPSPQGQPIQAPGMANMLGQ